MNHHNPGFTPKPPMPAAQASSRSGLSARPKLTLRAPSQQTPSLAPKSATAPPSNWDAWRVTPASGTPGDSWQMQSCPRCDRPKSNTLLVEPAGTRFYCVSCGFHGDATISPDRFTQSPPLEAIVWPSLEDGHTKLADSFRSVGFDPSAVTTVLPGVGSCKAWFENTLDANQSGWRPAMCLPCHKSTDGPILDWLFVAIDPAGGFGASVRLPRAHNAPWGWDTLVPGVTQQAIFVDRPVDRIALLLSGASTADVCVLCLPPTVNPTHASGGDWSCLAIMEKQLSAVHRIAFAFTDTPASHVMEEELGRRMGRERCLRMRWGNPPLPSGVVGSAAACFAQYGSQGVCLGLTTLTPYPIAGVHELMDVDTEYESLYATGLLPGLYCGLATLDDHYSVAEGEVTVVHGIPGHGKTTLIEDICLRLARRYDYRFGLFSPENPRIARHFASLTEKHVGKPFTITPGTERISITEKNIAKRWLNDHFWVIQPDDEQGNWSLDGVLELARTLVYRHGIRGLVLDPWNQINHQRQLGQSLDDYLAWAIPRLVRFARVYGVHIWVACHPRTLEKQQDGRYPVPTPYLIHGGAMWYNMASNILAAYRNRGQPDETILDIHIQKIRYREIGRIGRASLRWSEARNRFIDDVDQALRHNALCHPDPTALASQLTKERHDTPV